MFDMEILEVAIGLFFGYLVLSFVVTAANEMSAAWFRRRAWMLRKGITQLLNDDELAARFYDHPMIQGVSSPPGLLSRVPLLQGLVGRGPSYIKARTFTIALLDVVQSEPVLRAGAAGDGVRRTLALLEREAGGDPVKFRANVETWFNDSMERVSGWYRRRTQVLLLFWAAAITVATNADSLVIAKALWRDPALRQSLVARAEQYAAEQQQAPDTAPVVVVNDGAPAPPPLPPDQQADVDFAEASAQYDAALADLAELQLPIGWEAPSALAESDTGIRLVTDTAVDDWPGAIWEPGGVSRWMQALDQHLIGWLLTMLAVSLGAPFWFDMLNRLISIRGAGRAPPEAPKAGSAAPRPRQPDEEFARRPEAGDIETV
jgi:hypothetical protein